MIKIETIYFLVVVNVVFLILGTLLGSLLSYFIFMKNETPNLGFFKKNQHDSPRHKDTISIDEKKVVVNIKTDDLEKKYDSLGTTTKTDENISSSVNKLKNLKR